MDFFDFFAGVFADLLGDRLFDFFAAAVAFAVDSFRFFAGAVVDAVDFFESSARAFVLFNFAGADLSVNFSLGFAVVLSPTSLRCRLFGRFCRRSLLTASPSFLAASLSLSLSLSLPGNFAVERCLCRLLRLLRWCLLRPCRPLRLLRWRCHLYQSLPRLCRRSLSDLVVDSVLFQATVPSFSHVTCRDSSRVFRCSLLRPLSLLLFSDLSAVVSGGLTVSQSASPLFSSPTSSSAASPSLSSPTSLSAVQRLCRRSPFRLICLLL